MPFYLSSADAEQPKVTLEVVDDRRFRLMTAFVYEDPFDMASREAAGAGADPAAGPPPWLWQVPGRGEITDLASVPPLLWGWFAPYGRQLLPALLHDHYCAQASALVDSAPAGQRAAARRLAGRHRAHADLLFRRSLREQQMPFTRRWLMWAAVSLDGMWSFRRIPCMVTALLAVVLSWLIWSLSWRLDGPVVALTVAAAPAVIALLVRITGAEPVAGRPQGRWWGVQRVVTVAVLGGYVLPIALSLLAVTWLAGAVLVPSAVLMWAWALAHKARVPRVGPPPRSPGAGPLLVRRT